MTDPDTNGSDLDWRERVNQAPPAALIKKAPKGGSYIQLKDLERMADRLWGPEGWRIEYEVPDVVSDVVRQRPPGSDGKPKPDVRIVTARAKATVVVSADEQVVRSGIGADSAMYPAGPDDCTALENAIKAAATSAAKRAFAGVGRLFGRGL